MRAQAAALGVVLLAFACSDARCAAPQHESAAQAAPPAGDPPARAAARAEPRLASDPAPRDDAEPAQPDAQTRIGEVLDADPHGAGLDFLMLAAREDPDASVREAAVIALGDSDESRALDALIAASEDADSRVVRAALDALAWSDDRQARAALERLARHPDPGIAAAAEDALTD